MMDSSNIALIKRKTFLFAFFENYLNFDELHSPQSLHKILQIILNSKI